MTNEDLRAQLDTGAGYTVLYADDLRRLLDDSDEAARLRDDAERLDSLERAIVQATTKCVYLEYNPDDGYGIWVEGETGDEPDFDGSTLREAIDAAREEPKP